MPIILIVLKHSRIFLFNYLTHYLTKWDPVDWQDSQVIPVRRRFDDEKYEQCEQQGDNDWGVKMISTRFNFQ